jgi:hypothetical protein
MFLAAMCQHASGACQSHSHPVLSLREASRKYVELSPSTPPLLTLQFREKDLMPTPNLLRIRLILPPLGHILSSAQVICHHDWCFCVAKQVYFVVLGESDVLVVADFLECLAHCRAYTVGDIATALGQANCRLVTVYLGRVNCQTLKIGLVARPWRGLSAHLWLG